MRSTAMFNAFTSAKVTASSDQKLVKKVLRVMERHVTDASKKRSRTRSTRK